MRFEVWIFITILSLGILFNLIFLFNLVKLTQGFFFYIFSLNFVFFTRSSFCIFFYSDLIS